MVEEISLVEQDGRCNSTRRLSRNQVLRLRS